MKNILKYLITAFFAVNMTIFTVSAVEWRAKPVQCGDTKELYRDLIDEHNVKPMFVAIEMITNSGLEQEIGAIIFYMNLDNGKWIMIEKGNTPTEACVVALGTDLNFDINEHEIREMITGEKNL